MADDPSDAPTTTAPVVDDRSDQPGSADHLEGRPLPGDAERLQLPERVLPYWRLISSITWLPLILVPVAIALAVPGLPMVIRILFVVVPVLAAVVDVVFITPVRRSIWWYAVGEHQIDLEHGWLIVTRTVIPMTRVQHVELEHGPIAQRFRLAQLEIHTAAGSVKIPALDRAEGERIRQRIADLARIADDL